MSRPQWRRCKRFLTDPLVSVVRGGNEAGGGGWSISLNLSQYTGPSLAVTGTSLTPSRTHYWTEVMSQCLLLACPILASAVKDACGMDWW